MTMTDDLTVAEAVQPEVLLREVAIGQSYVRGVPPPDVCLTVEDKRWLNKSLCDWFHELNI